MLVILVEDEVSGPIQLTKTARTNTRVIRHFSLTRYLCRGSAKGASITGKVTFFTFVSPEGLSAGAPGVAMLSPRKSVTDALGTSREIRVCV